MPQGAALRTRRTATAALAVALLVVVGPGTRADAQAGDDALRGYLARVQARVSEQWKMVSRSGAQPAVVFQIHRDGTITDVAIEKSSGRREYDAEALKAIERARPFPPLPIGVKQATLRVHLQFQHLAHP